jgi:hypothetical protein
MRTIKDLPLHTRPRKKLREKVPAALIDEGLVSAILGMGTAGIDLNCKNKDCLLNGKLQ